MSAFSNYQYQSLPFDSLLLQNNLIKMSAFREEANINNTNSFLPSYPPQSFHHPHNSAMHETGCAYRSPSTVVSDSERSAFKKQSTDSSTVVDKIESGEQVTQKVTPMDKKRKNRDGSSLSYAQSQDAIESRGRKQRKHGDGRKEEGVKKPKMEKKDDHKVPEEPPAGYIHVRARRGQATDSHSLAERIRREKISERMKILQTLVPGCDKVTGKALMLDEIINYVQSLQNQVEFLSMKLASVNPVLYDFGMDPDVYAGRPEAQLPYMPLYNMIQSTPGAPNTASPILTAGNNFIPQLDSPALLLEKEEQHGNTSLVNLDGVSLLLVAEEERQKFLNSSGSFSNNSFFFH